MFGRALLIAVALLAGCASKRPDEAPPPLPVEAVRGADVPVAGAGAELAYPATLHRDREAMLSVRVGGRVTSIPVRIGDRISAGRAVARVEATPFTAARQRAQADVDRLDRAVRRNDALVAAGAIGTAERDDARSALSAARAALANARYDERSATAVMPFSGVVLSRSTELGETVAAGQPLMAVADLSSALLARAAVPGAVAAQLGRGTPASVRLSGEGRAITGQVRRIGAASDARTGTVEVDIALPGGTSAANGAVASVSFAARPAADTGGARYPAEVLLDAQGGWGHVYVVEPKTLAARRTRVRIVAMDADGLRLAGLPRDARVITAGAGFVNEGQRVTVSAP